MAFVTTVKQKQGRVLWEVAQRLGAHAALAEDLGLAFTPTRGSSQALCPQLQGLSRPLLASAGTCISLEHFECLRKHHFCLAK